MPMTAAPMDSQGGPLAPGRDNAMDMNNGANAKSADQKGKQALTDSMIIVIAAWVILFLLMYSLRNHNA